MQSGAAWNRPCRTRLKWGALATGVNGHGRKSRTPIGLAAALAYRATRLRSIFPPITVSAPRVHDFAAHSHTPGNSCVRFVFGIAAASRNTRLPDLHLS